MITCLHCFRNRIQYRNCSREVLRAGTTLPHLRDQQLSHGHKDPWHNRYTLVALIAHRLLCPMRSDQQKLGPNRRWALRQ